MILNQGNWSISGNPAIEMNLRISRELSCPYTTTRSVESISITCGRRICNGTSSILRAISLQRSASLIWRGYMGATGKSVESHLVVCIEVDTFQDAVGETYT